MYVLAHAYADDKDTDFILSHLMVVTPWKEGGNDGCIRVDGSN